MNQDKEQRKQEILKLAEAYYEDFLKPSDDFSPGDRISYGGRFFDAEEVKNLISSSLDFWLTAGPYTEAFEKALGEYLDVPYVSFVNSGSSANLLCFMALTSPLLGDRKIRRGDEVITVSCGFPTTVAPIFQYGAIPVFLDVNIPSYNMDITKLSEALSDKTKAVFIAHTLGNPFDLETIKKFCDEHNLWLIEDNCDAMGSTYSYNGTEQKTGTIGDIGSASFYPPHHMTTGEGGAVFTKNPLLHRIVRSLRDWGRDCMCAPGQDNLCKHRYDGQYGNLPKGYDHKYVYSHFGYNLKATDMQAAVGCAQIQKLPEFTRLRREHFRYFYEKVKDLESYFILPSHDPKATPSWFGFVLTCRESVNRNEVVKYLEDHNIQTRMLFAGNLIDHPCFDEYRGTNQYRVVGKLTNSITVSEKTFWLGLYPGMTEKKLDYMAEVLHAYFERTER